MRAGELRHRVTIQKPSTGLTRNSVGEVVSHTSTGWTDVATVWAAIEPQSASEQWRSEHELETEQVTIRMRHRTDVDAERRIKWANPTTGSTVIYDIEGAVNVGTRNEELQVMAVRRGV